MIDARVRDSRLAGEREREKERDGFSSDIANRMQQFE